MIGALTAMDLSTAILVVDDDAGIREAMTEYFSSHGFIVESAANAGELTSLLSKRTWDLIVLDVMMPGEDGLSILKRLQQEGNTTPIIIQSAMGSDTDRIVGLELGRRTTFRNQPIRANCWPASAPCCAACAGRRPRLRARRPPAHRHSRRAPAARQFPSILSPAGPWTSSIALWPTRKTR